MYSLPAASALAAAVEAEDLLTLTILTIRLVASLMYIGISGNACTSHRRNNYFVK